jgi:hypothetical protein
MAAEQYGHQHDAATASLSDAQASGDAAKIAAAQYELDQLEEQHQLEHLRAMAEQERAAADARVAKKQEAATKAQKHAELEYQARRDLDKRHLQDELDDLERNLANRNIAWSTAHKKLLKMFKGEFGPNMREAGNNLGKAFAAGLEESFDQVEKSAKAVAALVAKYLQLHSPADKGPLSSLNTWWTALGPTLLGGIDFGAMESQLAGQLAGVRSSALSGGTLTGAIAASSSSSGAGIVWTGDLHVEGNVIHQDDLTDAVRSGLYKVKRRNVSLELG